jgi:hypothetical protein
MSDLILILLLTSHQLRDIDPSKYVSCVASLTINVSGARSHHDILQMLE